MPQKDISTTPQLYLAASRPQLRVAEKHSTAIRWMHWINFPLLSLMILSGFMIYWADSIPGDGLSGQSQMHRVYRRMMRRRRAQWKTTLPCWRSSSTSARSVKKPWKDR